MLVCFCDYWFCAATKTPANISGSRKDREDSQHASESWTSQLSRKKKILKIGAWVTELFHFLCSYSNFVRAHTFFSHNSQANISGSRKDRENTQHASESWTSQLSREKKILKIGAWVTELFHFLCSYSDFVHNISDFVHNISILC